MQQLREKLQNLQKEFIQHLKACEDCQSRIAAFIPQQMVMHSHDFCNNARHLVQEMQNTDMDIRIKANCE